MFLRSFFNIILLVVLFLAFSINTLAVTLSPSLEKKLKEYQFVSPLILPKYLYNKSFSFDVINNIEYSKRLNSRYVNITIPGGDFQSTEAKIVFSDPSGQNIFCEFSFDEILFDEKKDKLELLLRGVSFITFTIFKDGSIRFDFSEKNLNNKPLLDLFKQRNPEIFDTYLLFLNHFQYLSGSWGKSSLSGMVLAQGAKCLKGFDNQLNALIVQFEPIVVRSFPKGLNVEINYAKEGPAIISLLGNEFRESDYSNIPNVWYQLNITNQGYCWLHEDWVLTYKKGLVQKPVVAVHEDDAKIKLNLKEKTLVYVTEIYLPTDKNIMQFKVYDTVSEKYFLVPADSILLIE